MKQCNKCGEVRPLGDFYRNKLMRDGHLKACKPCVIRQQMERYYRMNRVRPYVNPAMIPFATGRRVGYIPNPETGCWEWIGSLTTSGYGQVFANNRKTVAHRVYWEREHGPVPEGLEMDHLCRNPKCVNPTHLEAVDHATNVRRGAATKLTKAEVGQIRAAGGTYVSIGKRFGIDESHVSRIRSREMWR